MRAAPQSFGWGGPGSQRKTPSEHWTCTRSASSRTQLDPGAIDSRHTGQTGRNVTGSTGLDVVIARSYDATRNRHADFTR
jgi:hypothetical protein